MEGGEQGVQVIERISSDEYHRNVRQIPLLMYVQINKNKSNKCYSSYLANRSVV